MALDLDPTRRPSRTTLAAVTYAYPETPGEVRARLSFSPRQIEEAYRIVAANGEQAFFLSTCLRFEIVVPGTRTDLERILKTAFAIDEPAPGARYREDREAIHHLYRVAAGVESPVLGEREVLAQLRESLQLARSAGAVHGMFAKVVESAVGVGRAARERLPDSPHGSLAAVAAQLVGPAPEVAVFGAGTMARSVVGALRLLPAPPAITVFARRPHEVTLPGVDVRHMDEALPALGTFPAVVSATSAKFRLFDDAELRTAVAGRDDELILVDMAMPPDIDMARGLERVRYYGIDALADYARRSPRSDAADDFLAEAAADAAVRLGNHSTVGPVIASILRDADVAVAEEVERFASKLTVGAKDRRVLEQLGQTIARRILHRPVSFLSRHEHGSDAADTIAEAFGVGDDD